MTDQPTPEEALADALSGDLDIPELEPEREDTTLDEGTVEDLYTSEQEKAELVTFDGNYIEPWTRQPGEPDAGWDYFKTYRDMGRGRTITATAKQHGVSRNSLIKYASEFTWKDRAIAWDVHMDRVYRLRLQDAIKEMADRHASMVMEGIQVLALPFLALQKKMEANPAFMDEMSEKDVKVLIELAVKAGRVLPSLMSAERLARGMPTEIVDVGGEVKHTHEAVTNPDHIAEIISILERNRVLPGRVIEAETVNDPGTEDVQVHDDVADLP